MRSVLQINNVALAEKYLGLPTTLGRSSKEAFEYMPTRLKQLVGGWSGKEASGAGRDGIDQVGCTGSTNLSYELLPYSTRHLSKDEDCYLELLVGWFG